MQQRGTAAGVQVAVQAGNPDPATTAAAVRVVPPKVSAIIRAQVTSYTRAERPEQKAIR